MGAEAHPVLTRRVLAALVIRDTTRRYTPHTELLRSLE